MAELWQQSARELAALFRSGDASATEIVIAHLARIDDVNPSVNAVVRRIDERALADAAAADVARSTRTELGPLAGVPFTIKDNIDLAGDLNTHSVDELADFVPDRDAPVVERMKAAGAIPLARTNLPDLGLRIDTDSSLHGRTMNPWDSARTPGGSSGGEGAALATGMSPLGLGNDIGGSLRNPATCCGISSIKPTFGLVPHALVGPMGEETLVEQILAVEGPMARTVADVRMGLATLVGAHPRDPWSVPVQLESRTGPFRVAVVPDPPGGDTNSDIAALTARSADWLTDAGHRVEIVEASLYQDTLDCWTSIVLGGIALDLEATCARVGEDAATVLETSVEAAGELASLEAFEQAWTQRHLLIQRWNEFYSSWDAMVTPTWTQLPFVRGLDLAPGGAERVLQIVRPVLPANVMGSPSVAVPGGVIDDVPVGLLVNGPAWSDVTCLSLAEAIEERNESLATPIDPRSSKNG
jgi:amidase